MLIIYTNKALNIFEKNPLKYAVLIKIYILMLIIQFTFKMIFEA